MCSMRQSENKKQRISLSTLLCRLTARAAATDNLQGRPTLFLLGGLLVQVHRAIDGANYTKWNVLDTRCNAVPH